MRPFGIIELVRTGRIAMVRGEAATASRVDERRRADEQRSLQTNRFDDPRHHPQSHP